MVSDWRIDALITNVLYYYIIIFRACWMSLGASPFKRFRETAVTKTKEAKVLVSKEFTEISVNLCH